MVNIVSDKGSGNQIKFVRQLFPKKQIKSDRNGKNIV